jgi:hypothetical protein
MRIVVVCEGCVTQLSVQYFRKKVTNQAHDLHKLAMKELVTKEKLKLGTSSK